MNNYIFDGIEYRFYNHLFAVSECGKVLRKLQPYEPKLRKDGYTELGRHVLLHRAVATCWVSRPDGSNYVHHINHVRADNRAENLEWVTPKEHLGVRHHDQTYSLGKYERTPEHRETLRHYRTGKITSEETKAKQRSALLGRKRPFIPRSPHTQEWKDNMSENHHRNAACEVFGIIYRSFAEASRATGIHRFTLRKRCLSDNFPDYKIIQNS